MSNGGKDFDIDLPAGCTLLKRSLHMPDFDVYDVLCRGRQIGGVYVGNAPNALVKGRLIKTGRPFPAFIQIWTSDKPDDPAVADRIMASVRLHAAD